LKVICLVINGYRVKGTSYKLAQAEVLEIKKQFEGITLVRVTTIEKALKIN